jgi:photosystem II stability/assembly factor-like uncharacterized protein
MRSVDWAVRTRSIGSAALLVALANLAGGAPAVSAGVNVWTSHGPAGTNVNALAIDPATPETVYAGTGDGVFKSTNGGTTWNAANTGLPINADIAALAIDPVTPTILFAGTFHNGVFKSTDGGSSWTPFATGLGGGGADVRALLIDPVAHLVSAGTQFGGFFQTPEGTDNWKVFNSGLNGNTAVFALAIDPAHHLTMYAGAGVTGSAGVYRSTDGGGTWSPVFTAQGVLALAVDSATPTTIYAAASLGVFKSTDAGGHWTAINAGLETVLASSGVINTLVIDPLTASTLYVGTDIGGVFKSTDAGGTWHTLNTGLTTLDVNSLAIDPAHPTTFYAGTQGDGVFQIRQPIPTSVAATLSLPSLSVHAGDSLVVNLTASNLGPAGFLDVFFGLLLPAATGPALGCPGDAVAFMADAFTHVVVSCLSSPPQGFPPLFKGIALTANMPLTAFPGFFVRALPPGLAPGAYTVFLVVTPPGAFLDGTIDSEDLVAVASTGFTLVP